MEIRELLSTYDFPGDDIPIIAGSALAAMEGRDPEIGERQDQGTDGGCGRVHPARRHVRLTSRS